LRLPDILVDSKLLLAAGNGMPVETAHLTWKVRSRSINMERGEGGWDRNRGCSYG